MIGMNDLLMGVALMGYGTVFFQYRQAYAGRAASTSFWAGRQAGFVWRPMCPMYRVLYICYINPFNIGGELKQPGTIGYRAH